MDSLIEFYDARDLLLGKGNYGLKHDFNEGLIRLKKWCTNYMSVQRCSTLSDEDNLIFSAIQKEALFVCSLFPGNATYTSNVIKQILLEQPRT